MDLIKDIGKSLKFKERYDDLDRYGMEEYDKDECKQLRELEESGAPLSESQKETLHYCNTIKGERTRAAMNLGTAAVKVGVGAATSNPNLIKSGITDAGGYIMSEAKEVDGPNDGVGQQLNSQDFLKTGGQVLSGAIAFAAGKGGGEATGGEGGVQDVVSQATQVPQPNVIGAGKYGGGVLAPPAANVGGDASLAALLQNPAFLQLAQGQQAAQNAFQTGGVQGGLDFLSNYGVNSNNNGSKLKRSTRQHDYIKGNTRGYK